jgi:hypothetical protein
MRTALIACWALLVALSLLSCDKDEPQERLPFWKTTAQKNGALWQGSAVAWENPFVEEGKINLTIYVGNEKGHFWESLHFFQVPLRIDKYRLDPHTQSRVESPEPGASYKTHLELGHVAGDDYSLLEGMDDNYIELTRIEGKAIEGHFQAAFIKKQPSRDPTAPDTVIFKGGVFEAWIQDTE